MVTQQSTDARMLADHPRPTSPLPLPAAAALSRPERAFPPAEVVKAVTRYEVAAARYDELIARPASTLSPAEFDAFQNAQQTMADAFAVLAEAGRTDLLKPLETADQYRTAALRAAKLAAKAVSDEGPLSDLEADDLVHAEDLMAGHRATLAAAGRLDLVGGA